MSCSKRGEVTNRSYWVLGFCIQPTSFLIRLSKQDNYFISHLYGQLCHLSYSSLRKTNKSINSNKNNSNILTPFFFSVCWFFFLSFAVICRVIALDQSFQWLSNTGYNCRAWQHVQELPGQLYRSTIKFQCLKHALSACPHTSDHLKLVAGVGWMQWLVLLILIS